MNKPEPLPHVYDWIKLRAWLAEANPAAAEEMGKVVADSECSNGHMLYLALEDWKRGWCGDALSATSIAFLEENIAVGFWLRVWW